MAVTSDNLHANCTSSSKMAPGSSPTPRKMPYTSGAIRIRHAIPKEANPPILHGDTCFMSALLSFRYETMLVNYGQALVINAFNNMPALDDGFT